jgi:hypothetical protein
MDRKQAERLAHWTGGAVVIAITELAAQNLCLLAGAVLLLGLSLLLAHRNHLEVAIALARAAVIVLAIFLVVWIIGISTHWKGL